MSSTICVTLRIVYLKFIPGWGPSTGHRPSGYVHVCAIAIQKQHSNVCYIVLQTVIKPVHCQSHS